MDTPAFQETVNEVRTQWKLLWQNRIDDKVRAEGIANHDYSNLFIDRGTIIIATRDYKPPDFVEILRQHLPADAQNLVPPNPTIGGWGRFIRDVLRTQKGPPQRRLRKRSQAPPKPQRDAHQPRKKGGRGWLHSRMM